jgi:membrane fusion protein, heavy metal efflux system
MTKISLYLITLTGLLTWSIAAYAEDDHKDHDHAAPTMHDAKPNHALEGGHPHEDSHSHKDKNHEEHDAPHEDGEEHGGHEEHDGHEEHGEDTTSISPEAARQAGIVVMKASPGNVKELLTLTGRVTLNPNTTVNVPGRFPGIVKSVHVNLGEQVKKGQILARIESNESLRVYKVTAPMDGVILERNTNSGDVAGDNPLFKVADLSDVWAEFHIFPKDLDRVLEGMPVRVHTLNGNVEQHANINLILPTADRFSQTIQAFVTLPNPSGHWRPGMMVEGDVVVREKRTPIAVKASAMQTLENRQVIFVQEGSSFQARPVETGIAGGGMVEILSGLKSGEVYAAEGSFIIKADIGKEAAEHNH